MFRITFDEHFYILTNEPFEMMDTLLSLGHSISEVI